MYFPSGMRDYSAYSCRGMNSGVDVDGVGDALNPGWKTGGGWKTCATRLVATLGHFRSMVHFS